MALTPGRVNPTAYRLRLGHGVINNLAPFTAAGANHSQGLVPDSGPTTHSPPYVLCDDGLWHPEGSIQSAPFLPTAFLVPSTSTYNVQLSDHGKLISSQSAGGALQVNLPTQNSINTPAGFIIGFYTWSTNQITVNAGGNINPTGGASTIVLTSNTGVIWLVAEGGGFGTHWFIWDASQPFQPSGVNHLTGLVPDPGITAGTTRLLREDGGWVNPSTKSIQGITDGSNAAAGFIGEYISSGSLSGVALTSGVTTNIGSITLTPGDWDINANFEASPAGGATITLASAAISNTSGSLSPAEAGSGFSFFVYSTTSVIFFPVASCRVNITTNTQYWLTGSVGFGGGTCSGGGIIKARRAR